MDISTQSKSGGVNMCFEEHMDDPFYRYTRPKATIIVEGKRGSERTIVTNIFKIAAAMEIPVEFPSKFLGLELHARHTLKKSRGALVNGIFDVDAIETALIKFVRLYVLCPGKTEGSNNICGLVELDYEKKGKKRLAVRCRACGYGGALSSAATRHKLYKSMLASKSLKVSASEKESDPDSVTFSSTFGETFLPNDVPTANTNDDVAEEEEKKKVKEEDEDSFETDSSEAAMKARIEAEFGADSSQSSLQRLCAVTSVVSASDSAAMKKADVARSRRQERRHIRRRSSSAFFHEERLQCLAEDVLQLRRDQKETTSSGDDEKSSNDDDADTNVMLIFDDLRQEWIVSHEEFLKMVIEALLIRTPRETSPVSHLEAYCALIRRLLFLDIGDPEDGDVDTALMKSRHFLLTIVADFCDERSPRLPPKIIPLLLRVLYVADVVDEDAIFNWFVSLPEGGDDSTNKTRENASIFVTWLRDAEESSDDEDDDDDDDDDV